jgi:hypothetical protein
MSKFFSLFALLVLLASCGKPSAAKYAEQFCNCSEDLAKARIQLENNRIDSNAYKQIEIEQLKCMGEGDPRSAFQNATDSFKFEAAFLEELKNRCPNVARNYGFDVD